MLIAMHSSNGMKFLEDIRSHWESRGHTVDFEPGVNPELDAKADLVYIDCLDNNFYRLFNGEMGSDAPNWKSEPKKKLWVRAIDLDVWMGRHRDPRIWKYLDGMIVINDFFKDKIISESNDIPVATEKVHRVYCGVNLDSFPLKKDHTNNLRIAAVTGDMWYAKAPYELVRLVDMARKLNNEPYTLHIRGQQTPPEWHDVAWEHLLDTLDARDWVTVYPPQPNMNDWYEDKDYILCMSYKEGFSYAVAEGMSKGLKPIISNFFCAEELWPKEYIYRNWDDAAQMLYAGEEKYIQSEKYREFVEKTYPVQKQLEDYDRLMGT